MLAGGLQRGLGVDITVQRGVKYLEDRNRRYGRDKMLPLLCRILKLRKISAKHVLNDKGQRGVNVIFSQILSSWRPQKVIRLQIFHYSNLASLLGPAALSRRVLSNLRALI